MKFYICRFWPGAISVRWVLPNDDDTAESYSWTVRRTASISWRVNYRWSSSFTNDLKASNVEIGLLTEEIIAL